MDKYFNDDTISEEDFIKEVQTGDIVLFETDNFSAKLQRKFTGSKYGNLYFYSIQIMWEFVLSLITTTLGYLILQWMMGQA